MSRIGRAPITVPAGVEVNPAEHIGIADRVGSLEEGKDADVVIVDGCPFDVTDRKSVV